MVQAIAGTNIFSTYMQHENLFLDKKALTSTFVPNKIPHREEEIRHISSVLAPVLKGYNPSNAFIYGTCGTGKTISVKFVVNQLKAAASQTGQKVKIVYINCKMKKVADTEYRLFAQLLKEFGDIVPDTGLPTDVLYRRFFEAVDSARCNIIIVLDEIDALVRKIGDDFLYNFTRINTELRKSHVCVVGITNDLSLRDSLDLRVKSSLSEEETLFRPYNAVQLKDILTERIGAGFKPGTVTETAVSKCAALAAQEHGDARRALDLVRVAGELAERNNEKVVEERHVDAAERKIDMDRVLETVRTQPRQSQAVLYSVLLLNEKMRNQKKWADKRLLTGDVFTAYQAVCRTAGLKELTQRRVSDLIGELDMLGIITAKVISNGRYGRTREIVASINEPTLSKVSEFLQARFGG